MEQLATRDPVSCQCSHESPLTLCNISYHRQRIIYWSRFWDILIQSTAPTVLSKYNFEIIV